MIKINKMYLLTLLCVQFFALTGLALINFLGNANVHALIYLGFFLCLLGLIYLFKYQFDYYPEDQEEKEDTGNVTASTVILYLVTLVPVLLCLATILLYLI